MIAASAAMTGSIQNHAISAGMLALLALTGCVTTRDMTADEMTTDSIQYAVVRGSAVAVSRPRDGAVLGYPWMTGLDVIMPSCGFARVVYHATPLQEGRVTYRADEGKTRETAFKAMTGEWCALSDLLLEEVHYAEHLITYRVWKGQQYLLDWPLVFNDNDGADYIADTDFVDSYDLQPLLRDVVQGDDNSGCDEEADMRLRVGKHGDLIQRGGKYCAVRGVYLQDLTRWVHTQTAP
jgi:hypothetical protein